MPDVPSIGCQLIEVDDGHASRSHKSPVDAQCEGDLHQTQDCTKQAEQSEIVSQLSIVRDVEKSADGDGSVVIVLGLLAVNVGRVAIGWQESCSHKSPVDAQCEGDLHQTQDCAKQAEQSVRVSQSSVVCDVEKSADGDGVGDSGSDGVGALGSGSHATHREHELHPASKQH